jgi:hypothetical protein
MMAVRNQRRVSPTVAPELAGRIPKLEYAQRTALCAKSIRERCNLLVFLSSADPKESLLDLAT